MRFWPTLVRPFIIVLSFMPAAQAQTGTISGRVIDDRIEQPLAGVLVHVEHQPVFGETDSQGRFSFAMAPGTYTIAASLIGHAVVRATAQARPDVPVDLVVRLPEGAGTYTERVMSPVGASRTRRRCLARRRFTAASCRTCAG